MSITSVGPTQLPLRCSLRKMSRLSPRDGAAAQSSLFGGPRPRELGPLP
jgi:hypothetical protein